MAAGPEPLKGCLEVYSLNVTVNEFDDCYRLTATLYEVLGDKRLAPVSTRSARWEKLELFPWEDPFASILDVARVFAQSELETQEFRLSTDPLF
jgi:hypothetical protein